MTTPFQIWLASQRFSQDANVSYSIRDLERAYLAGQQAERDSKTTIAPAKKGPNK